MFGGVFRIYVSLLDSNSDWPQVFLKVGGPPEVIDLSPNTR